MYKQLEISHKKELLVDQAHCFQEPDPDGTTTSSPGQSHPPSGQESYTVSVSLMPTPNNKKSVDCWYSLILPEEEVRLVRFRERDFLRG